VILPSIPLAFLIMIEHMINVNLYAGLIHDHPSVDNNLELFALGTTNIVASLFSSFGKYMRCVCVTLEFICIVCTDTASRIRPSVLLCVFFLFQLRAMVFPEHP
jgi:MFS superfamily sulfate permease-like transporter